VKLFHQKVHSMTSGENKTSTTDETPEPVTQIAEGFSKSPDHDAIAPTATPMIPTEQVGGGSLSPWAWGSALIVVLLLLAFFFGR